MTNELHYRNQTRHIVCVLDQNTDQARLVAMAWTHSVCSLGMTRNKRLWATIMQRLTSFLCFMLLVHGLEDTGVSSKLYVLFFGDFSCSILVCSSEDVQQVLLR